MIVSAAVCPHPPVLVAGLIPIEPAELGRLRSIAVQTVREALQGSPEEVLVIGPGELTEPVDGTAGTDFHRMGVRRQVGGPNNVLRYAMGVGSWLLDEAGWRGPRRFASRPVALSRPTMLLVMAEGSAKVGEHSPGGFDHRSVKLHSVIERGLTSAAAHDLVAIDENLSAELWSSANPSLTTMGTLVIADQAADGPSKSTRVVAQLRYNAVPFGVASYVALWRWIERHN